MKIPNFESFPSEGIQLDELKPKEFSLSIITNDKPIYDPFKARESIKRRKAFKVIQGGKSGNHE